MEIFCRFLDTTGALGILLTVAPRPRVFGSSFSCPRATGTTYGGQYGVRASDYCEAEGGRSLFLSLR
jgi:hypothetical protein